MGNKQEEFDSHQSLDSLLAQSQLNLADYGYDDLQLQSMLERVRPQQEGQQYQNFEQPQAYSRDTPAQQHEKLLYMKNKANYLPENREETQRSFGVQPTRSSSSFLDDQFVSTGLDEGSLNNANNQGSFSARSHLSNDMNNSYHEKNVKHEGQSISGPELLFQQGDDAMFSFADDLSSSVGSSMNSEMLGSSLSSSFSFQPQSLNGPSNSVLSGTANISSHLSPIIKSPASSVRASSYLSTSLRSGNLGTPGTPKTRHASLSNNMNSDMLYSSSVPRSISHLSAEEKLRRKREFHNAVERRRRELIKQKIKELGNIVPPSLLNYNSSGKQIKPNKGIILNRTVEYLEYLLHVLDAQDRKRKQLLGKVEQLEHKKQTQMQVTVDEGNDKVPTTSQAEKSDRYHQMENEFQGIDTDVSQERIIDGRAKPQQLSNTINWDNDANIYNSLSSGNISSNSNNDNNNFSDDKVPMVNDDLEQFLSGDLVEAEDNARLLFNSGQSSADYLLEFDS